MAQIRLCLPGWNVFVNTLSLVVQGRKASPDDEGKDGI